MPTGPLSEVDTDNDGIADGYELAHGSDPGDPSSLPSNLDLDGNGSVDVDDALLLYKRMVGLASFDPGTDVNSLDLNGDGVTTLLDALLFYRNRAGSVPVIPLP